MKGDDKPISLRDQFAMAAMQSIINNRSDGFFHKYITGRIDDPEEEEWDKMERIAIVAYKMADAMRKVRLKAFD